MKSLSMHWLSFLIALALALALWLSPWPYAVGRIAGLPDDSVGIWSFVISALVFLVALHGLRCWNELPPQRQKREAMRLAAAQLARAVVLVALFVALFWMLREGDQALLGGWLQSDDWIPSGVETVLSGALCWMATRGANVVAETIWPGHKIEALRAPDGAALCALKKPVLVRSAGADARILTLILVALSAICLVIYAWTALVSRTTGAPSSASLTWAVAGLVTAGCALRCWWECLDWGTVTPSEIRPRLGRACKWWDVARVEEANVARFIESDERRLIFRDAQGRVLWQLPLDEINEADLRELMRLFPAAKTPSPPSDRLKATARPRLPTSRPHRESWRTADVARTRGAVRRLIRACDGTARTDARL